MLDLATGRLLALEDIVDTSRIDEINEVWIGELDTQGGLRSAAQLRGEAPQFDSLTLLPDGVEFGTDRNSLGGGTPGTATFVSFTQLGDLVNPELVARIAGN